MNKSKRLTLAAATVAIVVAIAIVPLLRSRDAGSDTVAVTIPDLSPVAEVGRIIFGEHCATCHGATAGGTDKGPPLIHRLYHPGHHADLSFALAIQRGSRAHHWRFGDMPPQPDVAATEIEPIIAYVRELQKANGIF